MLAFGPRAAEAVRGDLDLHEKGYGFDLTFHFEKNSYFKETTLKKTFNMSQQNVIDGCVGTPITWLPGCDVTHTKKKKGKVAAPMGPAPGLTASVAPADDEDDWIPVVRRCPQQIPFTCPPMFLCVLLAPCLRACVRAV